jgi:hypothetical protein
MEHRSAQLQLALVASFVPLFASVGCDAMNVFLCGTGRRCPTPPAPRPARSSWLPAGSTSSTAVTST